MQCERQAAREKISPPRPLNSNHASHAMKQKVHEYKQVKHHKHRSREVSLDLVSTCLSQGSYDPRSKELTLTFVKDGSVYTYDDVSRGEMKNLRDADSPGGVFNDEIR
jgi:hypothetical protein